MDRWHATIYRVAKTWTGLKQLSKHAMEEKDHPFALADLWLLVNFQKMSRKSPKLDKKRKEKKRKEKKTSLGFLRGSD